MPIKNLKMNNCDWTVTFKKSGYPASSVHEEGLTTWSPTALWTPPAFWWELSGGCPRDWGWASEAWAPGSQASYLLELKLSGESSGHTLDEVGEGEGTTTITAGREEREEPWAGRGSNVQWLAGNTLWLSPSHRCKAVTRPRRHHQGPKPRLGRMSLFLSLQRTLPPGRLSSPKWEKARPYPTALSFNSCPYRPQAGFIWFSVLSVFRGIFFGVHCEVCGTLVPWPGIEPEPPSLEAQSLNPWTTREAPGFSLDHSNAVPALYSWPCGVWCTQGTHSYPQGTQPWWALPLTHSWQTHSSKSFFQLLRMKSQARDCPMTLLAMLVMVEVASCFRMRSGFRV